jgi:hypothetical protein
MELTRSFGRRRKLRLQPLLCAKALQAVFLTVQSVQSVQSGAPDLICTASCSPVRELARDQESSGGVWTISLGRLQAIQTTGYFSVVYFFIQTVGAHIYRYSTVRPIKLPNTELILTAFEAGCLGYVHSNSGRVTMLLTSDTYPMIGLNGSIR